MYLLRGELKVDIADFIDIIDRGGVVKVEKNRDITELLMTYFDNFASDEYKYKVIDDMIEFRGQS